MGSFIDSYRYTIPPVPMVLWNYRPDTIISLPNIPAVFPIGTDFGTIVGQGNLREESFFVENTGASTIEVASITFSSPQLTYETETYNMQPGDIIPIGDFSKSLTIHATHDGDLGINAEEITITFVEGAATPNPLVFNVRYEFT